MNDLHFLALSAVLCWVMLMTAATLRTRAWTPGGFLMSLGNRDDLPRASALAERAERAARNMLENLLLFVCAWAAARMSGAAPERLLLGAQLFFWARVAYFLVYLAGVRFLRTAIWSVGVVGMAILVLEVFQ